MEAQQFFATAALGLEPLLVDELIQLGASEVKQERAGVAFSGTLETAYRVCLWSRLASRILLPLVSFPATDPEQLYREALKLDWQEHLSPSGSFAVDCTLSSSKLNHSKFAALKVKDAIVDQFRSRHGERPNVDTERPDLRVNLHVYKDQAILSVDLSGQSLHMRSYRIDGVHAPLKENLAAAILIRGGWPEISASGGALIDPMCGSGTLVLEAALIACDYAPGLNRPYFGFLGWLMHQPDVWEKLVAEAEGRLQQGLQRRLAPIQGFDSDSRAIKAAWQHAKNAGLDKVVHFEKRTVRELTSPAEARTGLLVANPPYGERLGQDDDLPCAL